MELANPACMFITPAAVRLMLLQPLQNHLEWTMSVSFGLLTSRHVTGAGPVAHWKQVTNVQVCTCTPESVSRAIYLGLK